MIHIGWFDEIELLYGPVGHTHGGNDTNHNVHNNVCANFNSVTLPEFLNTFQLSWTNPEVRPQPVVVESVYDWNAYYEKHINHVGGITKTAHNPSSVRAMHLAIGKSNFIEMKYKGSPSDHFWKGSDDDTYRDSEGLVILRSYPVGVPSIVPPQPL